MSYINNRTMHDFRSAAVGSAGQRALLPSPQAIARACPPVDQDPGMLNLTALQVESSSGGILLSGLRSANVGGISIDSRTLVPGDLFFAIRGPRNDGHDHIAAALEKGACGIVVDTKFTPPPDYPRNRLLLQVEDTHRALRDLATEVRRLWRGSLIAVTGSMGKTTTKEFAAQVLRTEYSVYRSPGNWNNLFGLPLAIFGLSADDHIGVFELGMSARGEIAEMCRIAQPNIGILTNVAPVHLQFFGSLKDIAQAKGELVEALPAEGALIFNCDDPLVRKIAEGYSGRRISFGQAPEADVRAHEIETAGLHETRFLFTLQGVTYRALVPLAGVHYVINSLPAIGLAAHYRIPMEQVIESLRHLKQTDMRGQIVSYSRGFTVIDDSYNSNPRALTLMVEMVARIPGFTRRVLVAGEMLELGTDSASLHYQCGVAAAGAGIDLIIGVGGSASEILRGATDSGLKKSQTQFFPQAEQAIEYVAALVQPGDLVLIKGSRGIHLERVAQALRSRYEEKTS